MCWESIRATVRNAGRRKSETPGVSARRLKVPEQLVPKQPLQRSSLCEADSCAHARCRCPRGVEVAFRVLQAGESEDSLGASSSSAAPIAHAGARSRGHPLHNHAARRDSYDNPLLAFRSPTGFDPLDPPHSSHCTAPLLGFGSPSAQPGGGVYVASVGRAHPANYVPSTGFEPSRRFAPPPTLPTPSGPGFARGVLPSGVSPLGQARKLVASRIPLLAFLPRFGLSPPRTERTGGAYAVSLGQFTALRLLSPTGSSSVQESVASEPTV